MLSFLMLLYRVILLMLLNLMLPMIRVQSCCFFLRSTSASVVDDTASAFVDDAAFVGAAAFADAAGFVVDAVAATIAAHYGAASV